MRFSSCSFMSPARARWFAGFLLTLLGCSSSNDGPEGGAGAGGRGGPPGVSGAGGVSGSGAGTGPIAGASSAGRGGSGASSGGGLGVAGSGGTSAPIAGASAGGASAGTPGAGTGGALSGGAGGGTAGSGGTTPIGGSNAAGAATAGGPGGGCPAQATFCSGFEDAALPAGTVFKLNGDPATPWTTYFEVDPAQHKSGSSSLRVKTISEAGGAYKMLAVAAPGAAFWARFYIRSDVDLGVKDHNVFAGAADSDDPNGTMVEFAEDVGLSFNTRDDVRWPAGYGRLSGGGEMPFTLPKDTWHCIEISFDGPGKKQQLYIAGTLRIDAANYPSQAGEFKAFKFGYNALHGTVRKLWYDDVAVASSRIGCD